MKHSPFGDALRRLRREADLTLVDLADVLNISVAYMSAIERGTRNPPTNRDVQKLLEKLGCPERLSEMTRLAALSRKSVEISLEGTGADVADMLTALARRKEEGDLTSEEVQEILKILKHKPKNP